MNQIDLISLQAVERTAKLIPCRALAAFAGFGGEKKVVAIALHPRPQPQFRIAITGGGVNVIDPMRHQQIHRGVGFSLAHFAKRRRAKQGSGAQVAGAAKGLGFDHDIYFK